MEGRAGERHAVRLLSAAKGAAAGLLLAPLVPLAAGPASADDPPGNGGTIVDSRSDGVDVWVGTPGRGDDGSPGRRLRPVRRCRLELDAWPDGAPKWPLPGPDGSKYAWFWSVCDGKRGDLFLLRIDPANPGRPPAEVLAQEAYRFLPLPAPVPAFNPPGAAVVGVPTWLWTSPHTWGRREASVGAGGLSVRVQATPVSLTWRFAPGLRVLVCSGAGTPYDPARPPSAQRTGCAYTFTRSTARLPGRAHAASVTTEWQVDWQASDGTRGRLAPLRRTTGFRLPVTEVHTLVTGAERGRR